MKIGRNDPCPCGSGRKFKKCCIDQEKYKKTVPPSIVYEDKYDELDEKSNRVLDLINEKKLDEAEKLSFWLLETFPDQVDGYDRLGLVHKAKGQYQKSADYFKKAADFAATNEGFDQESIDYYLNQQQTSLQLL